MRRSGFLLVSLMMLFSTSPALAEVYSGALCNGATSSDVDDIGRNRFGVHNLSTTTAKTVHCGGATGGVISSVSARVFDRSPTDDVDCTLFVLNALGTTLFTSSDSTTGFSTNSLFLSLGAPNVSGAPILQCSIPAFNVQNGASHVFTYTITDAT